MQQSTLLASGQEVSLVPKALERLFTEVSGFAWTELVWSLCLVLIAVLAGRLLAALAMFLFGRWSKRTESVIDDVVVAHVRRPFAWLMGGLVGLLALPAVSASEAVAGALNRLLVIYVIVASGLLGTQVVKAVEEGARHRLDLDAADKLQARTAYTQLRGFRNIATFAVFMITIAFVLLTFESVRQLGTGLLASAGVAGVVLGFAAQKSISTLIAGIQIALTQPIRVDDVVIVEGEWGRIEEITLTYVVVKIWDQRRLVAPIDYFINTPFQNWTRQSADLLGSVLLQLDYSLNVDELRTELKRILDESKLWDGEVWGMQVTDSGERSMTVRSLFSAPDASKAWDLRCLVREQLITYVQRVYPDAFPKLRTRLSEARADDKERAGGFREKPSTEVI